jgi:hypothetical protein
MATRSATLAIVRDPAGATSAARPALPERKAKPRPRSQPDLVDRVDGLEVQIEGLQAQLAAREKQLAELVDTVDKQRRENLQLIDMVLASYNAPAAGVATKRPNDGRPKWLRQYAICKRTGELDICTEAGWVKAYNWMTPAQCERIVAELAKYPPPPSPSSR